MSEKININFQENFESSMWKEKPINNGLALKVFEEFCCDGCSCKTAVTDEMIASQTSFEE